MCGRYFLKSTPAEIGDLADAPLLDNFPPRYNIAPTQPIALFRKGESRARHYALARWGFIPEWAKGEAFARFAGKPLINARAETVAQKPTFRNAFKRRRCLIPADGFYEWRAQKDGKQPYAIRRADGEAFMFAGLWETARDGDGGEFDTAAILTVAAGNDIAAIHHREPATIAPNDYEEWLGADERDAGGLARMLAPAPAGVWRIDAVSRAVNSPHRDGPELIAPEQPAPEAGAAATLL